MKRNHYFCFSRGFPKPAWRVLGGILESSWRFLENLGGVLDASCKHLESKDVFLGSPWRSREGWELRQPDLVRAIHPFFGPTYQPGHFAAISYIHT